MKQIMYITLTHKAKGKTTITCCYDQKENKASHNET